MNRREIQILAVVAALIGISWGYLSRLQSMQRLGKPGLKLGSRPIHDNEGKVAATNSVDLPEQVMGFQSKESPVTKVELNWLPKDTTYGRRIYQARDGFEAMLSVVLMGTDRTSIHKPEYCLPSQGWRIEKSENSSIPMIKPHPYDLRVKKLTASLGYKDQQGRPAVVKGVYIYWFVADDELTPLHGERMWWITRDLLARNILQRWAYVTCFSTCQPGQEELLYERMKTFIALTVPEFQLAAGPEKKILSSASEPSKAGF
jgi:hypothetical protein